MTSELYRQEILEHARKPLHGGKLEAANVVASLANTTCGDEVTVYVQSQGDIVQNATFEGRGCIISQASADLFCDAISGHALRDVSAITPAAVLELFGSPVTPSRQTCVLLAYEALKKKLQVTNNT